MNGVMYSGISLIKFSFRPIKSTSHGKHTDICLKNTRMASNNKLSLQRKYQCTCT